MVDAVRTYKNSNDRSATGAGEFLHNHLPGSIRTWSNYHTHEFKTAKIHGNIIVCRITAHVVGGTDVSFLWISAKPYNDIKNEIDSLMTVNGIKLIKMKIGIWQEI